MATKFFIDQDAGLFVVGPADSSALPRIGLKNKDNYNVELYFLRQTGIFGRPYSFEDRSATTISIGLGQLSAAALATATVFSNLPTAVTTTITTVVGGSSTTSEIQKITFSRKPSGGVWQITVPEDSRSISSAVTAGVFIASAYHGFIVNQPITFPTITGASGFTVGNQYYVYDLQSPDRFRITSTLSGTVMSTITATSATVSTPARSTALLNSYSDAADVQAAMEALDTIGTGGVAISGVSGEYFYLSFKGRKANANFPPVTVLDSTLIPQYGKSGSINLSVAGLQTLLDADADDEIDLTFEVEVNDASSVKETYQTTVKVTEDLL